MSKYIKVAAIIRKENTFLLVQENLHVYLASIVAGNVKFPQDEIMDVKFFTLDQIKTMKSQLVGEWVYYSISGMGLS